MPLSEAIDQRSSGRTEGGNAEVSREDGTAAGSVIGSTAGPDVTGKRWSRVAGAMPSMRGSYCRINTP